MLTDRESIVNAIKRSGHKQGSRLLKVEKRFGIEFNPFQLQQVMRRAYGKSYLSYALALDEALDTDMTISERLVQTLDEDVDYRKTRLKDWFNGFREFADKQGFKVIRVNDIEIKVEAK